MKRIITCLSLALLAANAFSMEGYYRSPGLHGDMVVFTAESDLWLHRISNGTTERLTTHIAYETQASFSPNGESIAFTSNYEGAWEVYVIPVSGGIPKRVTYENSQVRVQGWTAEGKVLYTTNSRAGARWNMTLKTVDPDTLNAEILPLADAMDGAMGSSMLYFTRFGLNWFSDNVNVYRGGMHGSLWRFRTGSGEEAVQLATDHEGSVRRPMLQDDRLYFISDESGRNNLWSVNLDGGDIRQETAHDDLGIRGASIQAGRAIYQLGPNLVLMDLATGKSSRLEIEISSDHPGLRENWVTDPGKYITSAKLSGDGEKVTITARGRIAVAGTNQERLVSIGTPVENRMRNAALSRDGDWVYSISDAAGELELWKYSASGSDESERLTRGGQSLRATFEESPDGKWIAHDDGVGGLWLLNTRTGDNHQVVSDGHAFSDFSQLAFSPDSSLLAFRYTSRDEVRFQVVLHDIESKRQETLTSTRYQSFAPVFSPDGKWLYYLSDRSFTQAEGSVWSDRDMGPALTKRTGVFAHALTGDAEFPFQVPTELTPDSEDKEEEKAEENNEETAPVEVDWDGLKDRIWQVPAPAGDYSDLAINEEYLYLKTTDSDASDIKVLKMEPLAEAADFTGGVVLMQLSDDGKKMLVVKKEDEQYPMYIVPATAEFPEDLSKNTVQSANWRFSVDPRAEWRQMFHDAWLMHREMFYDRNMRGVDWLAMKEKYLPMMDRVTDRREVNDVLAQMTGELNALHSAVRGGDSPSDPDAPAPSVLGAELVQGKGGVLIERKYRYDREVLTEAPPLAMPGVDAQEGDLITAVNGIASPDLESFHRVLRNQAGKQVLLEIRRGQESIRTVVVPATADQTATYQYRDWVWGSRKKVEEANPDLGYMHIANMGGSDAASFARDFYASIHKKGMIIDVRRNGGGNIDSWLLDRLMRKAWMFWQHHDNEPYTNSQRAFRGHLVILADQGTYSDGETFTAGIRALGIAPVIGKRTAGAGVWLSGSNALSDKGIARVAEFPYYAMDGRWVVEGHGVEPDIEVDNLPYATFNGADAQLEAAIEYLGRKLEEEPIQDMVPLPFPPNPQPADDIKG